MKVAITGNKEQGKHLYRISELLDRLDYAGVDVVIEETFAGYLCERDSTTCGARRVASLPGDVGMVISLGGDGTFLRTADWIEGAQVPVMGINTGHLGYLAGFSLGNMDQVIRAVLGEVEVSSRITLKVACSYLPPDFSPYALNEISISKGDTTSMVEVNAYIDGHYLADYLADGMVVATPTGSTAYNLSGGGPIVAPTLECMVLTPIAPHSFTLRPLVVGAGSELVLRLRSRGEECHVGVDGRTFAVPSNGTELRLCKSDRIVKVAQPRNVYFSSVLRKKLRWGVR